MSNLPTSLSANSIEIEAAASVGFTEVTNHVVHLEDTRFTRRDVSRRRTQERITQRRWKHQERTDYL